MGKKGPTAAATAPVVVQGKGHPGARRGIVKSGNAGSSSATPPPTSTAQDGPPKLFPAGYKTPLSLLNERCQKNGWQKPDVQPFATQTGYGCIVRLTKIDPKHGAETITLRPPTDADAPTRIEKPTALEAKHWGAVYALHRFANGLQLGMVLPPQVRDYWTALQNEKKNAPAKDAWLYEADPFEAAKARAQAQHNAGRGGAPTTPGSGPGSERGSGSNTPVRKNDTPEFHMSSELKAQLQETIRALRQLYPPQAEEGATPPYNVSSKEEPALVRELGELGYREGHVRSAVAYIRQTSASCDPLLEGLSAQSLKETVLQYLQVILTEEELPSGDHGYQGRANANVKISKHGTNGSSGLKLAWLAEKISKAAGYPFDIVEDVLAEFEGDEAVALDVLARRLAGWTGSWMRPTAAFSGLNYMHDVAKRRDLEIEALESMLGRQLQRQGRSAIEMRVQSQPPVSLCILLSDRSLYPSASIRGSETPPQVPIFYVTSESPNVPAYIKLHLTGTLLRRMGDESICDWLSILQAGEGGLMYEMYAWLEDNVQEILKNPPSASEVLQHLKPSPSIQFEASPVCSGAGKKQHFARHSNAAKGDNEALRAAQRATSSTDSYRKMLAKRQSLPAWKSKQQLVSLIQDNRVVIVSGATGSGKTTQVPAFVLEDALETLQGAKTSLICTQPRRISAIGVANRVADERGEKVGQGLVGYAIRGERKASAGCRLLFCTTGILLQRLSRGGDPDLEGVSHVFVDEVHERSLDSDFLLLILKDVLKRNRGIKVILMSATAESERFSAYFGRAPCIEIPGQTHPVEDFYLEDVISATQYKASPLKASRRYKIDENEEIRLSLVQQGIEAPEAISTLSMLARAERIDYDLVAATVAHLAESSSMEEAILIFVTGVAEIGQTIRAIERRMKSSEVDILPLHANLSSSEQARVFAKTRRRKIIVSTNIAETSITVDDVVYVIDTGRVKETRFDAESGVQRLVEDWNSLAGAKQRRGRAGRVKPGQCWKLYTRWQEGRLPAQSQPEILRTPLASLILQVMTIKHGIDVPSFLGGALDAPKIEAIQEAIDTLRRLGAIVDSPDGTSLHLTSLGRNLALLPLDLRLGKMLILASIFDCLDPMLSICAGLSTKALFSAPLEKRDEAQASRQKFYTGLSDILTDLKALDACSELSDRPSQLRKFCEEHFISQGSLREIASLRADYVTALRNAGFAVAAGSKPKASQEDLEVKANLLKAIIYAGTGTAVRVRLPQARYEATIGGASQVDHEAREVKFFNSSRERVFLHPGSVLFAEPKLKDGYLTYFSMSVTSKPFLRDATQIPLAALLMFGRDLQADPLRGGLTVDGGQVRLRAPPRTSALINEMRRLLDVVLSTLVDDPESAAQGHSHVLRTISDLLARSA